MAQVLPFKEAPPHPKVAPGAFVETETARDILRSLQLAMATGGATMIAGVPGVGKSSAVAEFCAAYRCTKPGMEASQVLSITATSGMSGPRWVASEIFRRFDLDLPGEGRGLDKAFQFLTWELPGKEVRMVLVDEAQYLDQRGRLAEKGSAYEWLRGLCEAAGVALVFVGDLALTDGIERFPQLLSRMVRPVIVRRVTPGDVAALAASYGVTDAAAVVGLSGIARGAGALRNVGHVLRMARIFAGEDCAIAAAHVAAAAMELKFVGQGDGS